MGARTPRSERLSPRFSIPSQRCLIKVASGYKLHLVLYNYSARDCKQKTKKRCRVASCRGGTEGRTATTVCPPWLSLDVAPLPLTRPLTLMVSTALPCPPPLSDEGTVSTVSSLLSHRTCRRTLDLRRFYRRGCAIRHTCRRSFRRRGLGEPWGLRRVELW